MTEEKQDVEIECVDCHAEFTWTKGEQRFYEERNLQKPRRCKSCREARKARTSS